MMRKSKVVGFLTWILWYASVGFYFGILIGWIILWWTN